MVHLNKSTNAPPTIPPASARKADEVTERVLRVREVENLLQYLFHQRHVGPFTLSRATVFIANVLEHSPPHRHCMLYTINYSHTVLSYKNGQTAQQKESSAGRGGAKL